MYRVKRTPAPSDVGMPNRMELTVREELEIVIKGKTTSDELMGIVIAEVAIECIEKKIRVIIGALFRELLAVMGRLGVATNHRRSSRRMH